MPKCKGHGQALVLSQQEADSILDACTPALRAVFSFGQVVRIRTQVSSCNPKSNGLHATERFGCARNGSGEGRSGVRAVLSHSTAAVKAGVMYYLKVGASQLERMRTARAFNVWLERMHPSCGADPAHTVRRWLRRRERLHRRPPRGKPRHQNGTQQTLRAATERRRAERRRCAGCISAR